jgi:hypothetical protein
MKKEKKLSTQELMKTLTSSLRELSATSTDSKRLPNVIGKSRAVSAAIRSAVELAVYDKAKEAKSKLLP